MSFATTFYFQDVFPDYDSWKNMMITTGIVDYNDSVEAAFDKYCFNLLARHYRNNNIRYLDPNDFACELVNVYENNFKAFKKKKELIDSIYNLTLDEITEITKAITNVANNPNDVVKDPESPINFISAQTYQIGKNGRLTSYIEALKSIPDYKINDFLYNFKHLFMVIQPNNIYLY